MKTRLAADGYFIDSWGVSGGRLSKAWKGENGAVQHPSFAHAGTAARAFVTASTPVSIPSASRSGIGRLKLMRFPQMTPATTHFFAARPFPIRSAGLSQT